MSMKSFNDLLNIFEGKIKTKKVEVYEYNGKLYREKWEITRDKLGDSNKTKQAKALAPIIHDQVFCFNHNTHTSQIVADWIVDNMPLIKHVMEDR